MSDRFFYKTSKECCDFYFNGGDCKVIDACGGVVHDDDQEDDGATTAPTLKPTHKPTKTPGEIPITYQDDGCHPDRLWHADTRLGKYDAGCTNNDVYPPGWTKPPMSETMFFASPQECCEFFFEGKECEWIDVCAFIDLRSQTTSSSTVANGDGSTDTESSQAYTYPPDNPCHARKWHPDTNSLPSICTNDMKYPALWDNGIMDGISMFIEPEACCEKLKRTNGDDECLIVEDEVCEVIGESPATRPSILSSGEGENEAENEGEVVGNQGGDGDESNCGEMWHPDTGNFFPSVVCLDHDISFPSLPLNYAYLPFLFLSAFNVCTNSVTGYPSQWDEPPMNSVYMSDSSQSCCNTFFSGAKCNVNDVCTSDVNEEESTDCSKRIWHPDGMFSKCSNSGDYPTDWDMSPVAREKYLHDSYGECCVANFPNGNCPKEDVCDPPSCEDNPWHPDGTFSKCTNSGDYPTDWDISPAARKQYLHDSYDECCNANFSSGKCPKEDVCNPPSCEDNPWHPDGKFTKCTNSGDYPTDWDISPTAREQFLHESYDECCNANFSSGNCPKEDVCNPGVNEEESTDCSKRIWHPDGMFSKCSNSGDYPTDWDMSPVAREKYLHDSYGECCVANFPNGNCPKEDVCDPPSCEDNPWHPDGTFSKCTNSGDYPTDWDISPAARKQYLHDSYDECCNANFSSGKCPKEDVCNPPSCEDNPWHPDGKFTKCTNSGDYPTDWDISPTAREQFLHESYDECCNANFSSGNCPKEDVCRQTSDDSTPHESYDTHVPTLKPVDPGTTPIEPTSTPTTDQPSSIPTSESPTSSPNECVTAKWHPGEEGSCSNSPIYNTLWDMPALSKTYLHDTHASCCREFYGIRKCGVEDVCQDRATASPTQSPIQKPTYLPTQKPLQDTGDTAICGLKKFHPISIFDRKCTNDDKFPPLWNSLTSTYFFSTGHECCDAFYSDGLGSCEIKDICSVPDRTITNTRNCGKRWHPTSEIHRICSNGDLYPLVWDSLEDQFFFDTAEDCCEAFYSEGTGQCDILNTC